MVWTKLLSALPCVIIFLTYAIIPKLQCDYPQLIAIIIENASPLSWHVQLNPNWNET